MAADIVIGSRVSPKQKADLVNWVKNKDKDDVCLSIGDGSNDVNMITEAHVGVGILGKEGAQASRSADFAIGEFKNLATLLFWHGRESYRRNSFAILYIMWKNLMMTVVMVAFSLMSSFSPQPIFEPVLDNLNNVLFTAFPIGWYSITDIEYPKETLMGKPSFFVQGMINKCFNTWIFFKHYFSAIVCGVSIAVLVANCIGSEVNANQMSYDMWCCGNAALMLVVILSNIHILVHSNTITTFAVFLNMFGIVSFFVVVYFISGVPELPVVGTFKVLFHGTQTLLCLFIGIAVFAMLININDMILFLSKGEGRLTRYNVKQNKEIIEDRNRRYGRRNTVASADNKKECDFVIRPWIRLH